MSSRAARSTAFLSVVTRSVRRVWPRQYSTRSRSSEFSSCKAAFCRRMSLLPRTECRISELLVGLRLSIRLICSGENTDTSVLPPKSQRMPSYPLLCNFLMSAAVRICASLPCFAERDR